MKKILLGLVCIALCFSCEEDTSLIINNDRGKDLMAVAVMKDGTEKELDITIGKNIYDINGLDVKSIHIMKDYKYSVIQWKLQWFYDVYENIPITYTIKCLLPSDVFNGSESLEMEYQQRTERGNIVLGPDMIVKITSYDEPRLNRTTLNGYPVSLCRQDNQLIIY